MIRRERKRKRDEVSLSGIVNVLDFGDNIKGLDFGDIING